MNYRLIIGSILLVLVFLISILGPGLAPYAINHSIKVKVVPTSTGIDVLGAPFPPDKDNIFGTNEWGYDILTLLLYGARYTVFSVLIISVFRVLLGGALGLLLGINSARLKFAKVSALGGLPLFLILFFCMFGISINSTLPPLKLAVIQASLMIALGIPGIAAVISEKTSKIKEQQFVLAAQTYGAGKLRLAFRHILPVLKENLVILLVQEAIATLNILGQLGIFNLFLGGTLFTPNPMLFHSLTHEWAGLVGQARVYVSSRRWVLFYPLAAFMLILIALFIFSRGLEDYYRKKYNPHSHA